MTGTRSAVMTASCVLPGCDVGGRLCMGEEGALSRGEPSLEGARCCVLEPVEGKRRWPGVREGVASPTMVLRAAVSVQLLAIIMSQSSFLQMPGVAGQPWEHRGGILVGFLELRDRSHATPELLQRRVYACRHIFGLLHGEAVVDQSGKLEVVAASTAGLVQFESVALGAALENVGLVAALELLQYAWLAMVMVVPSSAHVVPRVEPPSSNNTSSPPNKLQGMSAHVQESVQTVSAAPSRS